jgi:D-amino-acid dehydrogenase
LARAGVRVTVVDQGSIGGACSHANCGLVCPSHVLPLAEPGAVRRAVGALLRRHSPLSIRPRLDWSLWSWLLRFAQKCNWTDLLHAGRAIQALLESSLALYRELLAQEQLACEWEERGLLFVFRSPREYEAYADCDQLLAREFGLPAERLDGAALAAFEPALRPGLPGGWFYPHDAHLRPDLLLRSWSSRLAERGVELRPDVPVEGLRCEGGLVRAARTSQGDLEADAFVLAAGAWTPRWSGWIGCPVPIEPGKGYSLTMPRPAICPRVPLIFPEHRVAVTPLQSGYRLGSTMEFAGYDATLPPARLQLLRDGALPYLREPWTEPVLERWFGWRPMVPDGLPIIDRAPAAGNLLVAAGHGMLGLSMAPATGRLVAELVTGTPTHVPRGAYSLARF